MRVKIRGHVHSGTACVMPEDDPQRRLDQMVKGKIGLKIVEGVTRISMTDTLTVRIDLHRPPLSG